MSEDNVVPSNAQLVRQYLEDTNAFMRGEMSTEEWMAAWDPQAELVWHDRRTYPDTPQQLCGVHEILAFTERYREEWSDVVAEPLELSEPAPSRVLVLTRQSSRGRQSGIPIVIHFWGLWTLRNEKLEKLEYFRHRADALEAAGVRE